MSLTLCMLCNLISGVFSYTLLRNSLRSSLASSLVMKPSSIAFSSPSIYSVIMGVLYIKYISGVLCDHLHIRHLVDLPVPL